MGTVIEMEQGYFDANKAADYLGVGRATFWRWRKKYHIRPIVVDGIIRYSKKTLDEFMEGMQKA